MWNKTGYCDFHCHLDDECYDNQREQIIDRCFANGLACIVTVADPCKKSSLAYTDELLSGKQEIYAVCGTHPHQADHYSADVEKSILDFLKKDRIVAVGEVGLDFHYDFASRENQLKTFKRQIAIAREHGLPLVIHSRNAERETLNVLAEEKFARPVVFHCFTGDRAAAGEIIQRGYSISFSGIITFKKADALREIVKSVPLTQLFGETDSPYLAPEPKRGEINTPLGVIAVIDRIAAIKNLDAAHVNAAVAQNLVRLMNRS
jgi:TatD DNase family protein